MLASLVIFVAALGVRGALLLAIDPHPVPQHFEVDNIAISVAKGQGFANPFSTPTGPSALYPPLYPLVLSCIYGLLGTGTAAELAKFALNVTGAALSFALLPWIAGAAGLPLAAGVLAGLMGAVLPAHFWIEFRGKDAAWVASVLLVQAILTSKLWRDPAEPPRRKLLFASGVTFGFGLLLNAATAAVLASWVAASVVVSRRKLAALRYLWIPVAVSLAIASPWLWRNYRVFGRIVPLRSNLGMELWVSNNPYARPTHYGNDEAGVYRRLHPLSNFLEREQMRAMGEVAYCQSRLRLALQWIRENPGRFAALTAQRIVLFWFTPALRPLQPVILWAITVLAWVGLWRSRTRHPLVFALVGSLWIGYPLLYYFVQVDMRYRYPIYWSFLLMAAYAVVSTSAGARLCARMEMQLRRWESVVSSWQLRRRRS
jgi:hypothetical protein